ncbi:MAG TPA: hypothetical protein PLV31_06600, partial [Gammaproteobacteria bacterium]|nr:hypothetical protein [Gammaproteobacteria bacterium]
TCQVFLEKYFHWRGASSYDESSSKNLKEAANEAIKQIDEKQYHITLLQHSIKHFLKIGVAFKGKELVMDYKIDA